MLPLLGNMSLMHRQHEHTAGPVDYDFNDDYSWKKKIIIFVSLSFRI